MTPARLILLLAVLSGCRDNREAIPKAEAPRVAPPRYWLSNTTLLEAPGGRPTHEVKEKRLVELLPGGRVRTLPGAPVFFEGALPDDVLREPHHDRGLMLYAQRTTELHWRRPDGPSLGRLFRGAWVSVTPGDGPAARVGNLPSEEELDTLVAYVDRAALGPDPQPVPPYEPAEKGRSKRLGVSSTGWVDDPSDKSRETHAAWTVPRCEEVRVLKEPRIFFHYSNGIELRGLDHDDLSGFPTMLFESLQRCPARAGTEALTPPAEDSLSAVIARRGSVYWIVESDTGLVCDEWTFAPSSKGPSGRLTRSKAYDGQTAAHPYRYEPAGAGHFAVLALSTLELNRKWAVRCECDANYTVVRTSDTEVVVIGHALPAALTSYDVRDTERWFLDATHCDEARQKATAELERDGAAATRLGLHAVLAAIGI